MYLSGLFDSVLKNEIVDQGKLNFWVLELTFKNDREQKFAVILSELLDSDGGLALISKLMDSA